MGEVNRAFIQKLAWNLLIRPDALLSQILKSKYFLQTSILEVAAKSGASIIWEGITRVLSSLRLNVCYLPRNGASIQIRDDPWIPTLERHLLE